MRILKWIVGIVLVLGIGIAAGLYFSLQATLPEYDGQLEVQDIQGRVTIIRDAFGMPHIYAANDRDLAYGLGFCTAQDRLFQMDLIRRAARGKLSKVLGSELIEVDRLFRTITASRSLRELFQSLPQEIRTSFEYFAKGVNGYLGNRSGPLPFEFHLLDYAPKTWKPEDGLAVYYYMAWDLNTAFAQEPLFSAVIQKVGREAAAELFVDYPNGYPVIQPQAGAQLGFLKTLRRARRILGTQGGGASNNWVLSGAKTETGTPLLANDMHLGFGLPGIWYEAHLVTPEMNVSGVCVPGVPFVMAGANEHVAWGLTNVMADDADFYLERIHPDDKTRYQYKGLWRDMQLQEELIAVKDGPDVSFTVRSTLHGPLISDLTPFGRQKGKALSMRWTAPEVPTVGQALYLMNRAESIDDFKQALPYFQCPGQNVVFADDQGNIGYWAAVAIPVRKGFSGALPVPGWDGEHEWSGFVEFAQQPHLINPKTGFIVTANNKHLQATKTPISHAYAAPDRFMRITEMLQAKDKLGVSDMKRIQNDVLLILAREWVPLFVRAMQEKGQDRIEAEALSELKAWEYQADAKSGGAAIFHVAVQHVVEQVFNNRLGPTLYTHYLGNKYLVFNSLREMVAAGDSIWFDDPLTTARETRQDLFVSSFREAVDELKDRLGPDVGEWHWGALHTLTLKHPFAQDSRLLGSVLNIGPMPLWGSLFTVNPGAYRLNDPFVVKHGASQRYVLDLSTNKDSWRVIPTGISGNFMSPHYDDQVDLWYKGKYRPFVLDRERVEQGAAHTLVLVPQSGVERFP